MFDSNMTLEDWGKVLSIAAPLAQGGISMYQTNRAAGQNQAGYGSSVQDMQNYVNLGNESTNMLRTIMANPSMVTTMPGYQFGRQMGEDALNRSSAAKGLNLSGRNAKGLMQWNQDYALSKYNEYLKPYQTAASEGLKAGATRIGPQTGYGAAGAAGTMGMNNTVSKFTDWLTKQATDAQSINALRKLFGGGGAALPQTVQNGLSSWDEMVNPNSVPVGNIDNYSQQPWLNPEVNNSSYFNFGGGSSDNNPFPTGGTSNGEMNLGGDIPLSPGSDTSSWWSGVPADMSGYLGPANSVLKMAGAPKELTTGVDYANKLRSLYNMGNNAYGAITAPSQASLGAYDAAMASEGLAGGEAATSASATGEGISGVAGGASAAAPMLALIGWGIHQMGKQRDIFGGSTWTDSGMNPFEVYPEMAGQGTYSGPDYANWQGLDEYNKELKNSPMSNPDWLKGLWQKTYGSAAPTGPLKSAQSDYYMNNLLKIPEYSQERQRLDTLEKQLVMRNAPKTTPIDFSGGWSGG
jgi:hypothetical protein